MASGRKLALAVAAILIGLFTLLKFKGSSTSWNKESVVEIFKNLSDQLGNWAIPVYVAVHTVSLSLCLPYAVFFEAGASILFGFFPALLCVFSAKVLGASLSFWIGRLILVLC
ncbi:SNARE associated Golgi protein family [Artemisia annua]|uniref:SNARE associated Golgi protein family n=1 Tax=Artemisia annua TaxID=35608 RepID=A0A2U1KKQ7_ARTAN|nr:SNARE associated Golgi protein family [Artemisia annua]